MWFSMSRVFEQINKYLRSSCGCVFLFRHPFCKLSEIDLFSWIWYSYRFCGKVFPTQVVLTVFKHKLAQPTALMQKHLERWGCVALCGYVFSEICYRHLPPLHAILQQKQTNLPRQFLCQRFCLQTGIPDSSFSGSSGKHGKINNLANHTTKKQARQGQETIDARMKKKLQGRKSAMAARTGFVDGARGPSLFCGGTEAKWRERKTRVVTLSHHTLMSWLALLGW
jgi:hypothetical protein